MLPTVATTLNVSIVNVRVLNILIVPCAIDVVVGEDVPVHVNVDVAVSPTAASPGIAPTRSACYAHAERNRGHSCNVARRVVRARRIGWIPLSAVHHGRIVRGNVNNLRVGRFNHDHLGLRLFRHDD